MPMIKAGVIGAGGMGAVHIKNLHEHEHVQLAAICDSNEALAKAQAEQYGAAYYTDGSVMIEQEPLDVLYICIPPFCHGDLEERAAAKGIHLMVEKPLGLDLEAVRSKAKAIADSGIIAASGYCLRYLDTVAIAKDYLKDKKIGMVRAHYITVPVPTPWWRKKELSGGQLVEQSTHTLDLVRYLCGDITNLYANMDLLLVKDIPDLDIPDVGVIQFVLESGALGQMQTGFIQFDHRTGVEIMGRDFRLVLDGTTLSIVEKGKETIYHSNSNFYKNLTDALVEAIRQKDPSLVLASYEEGLKTLEATLAANESAETGQVIQLSSNK
ncbi:oxidoreductase domain protein [Paenibacillus lactis 154]|uniref:Oxidoreductase domain protein n=2 Tax=Paenibacillus lactis TaxID=228574 RepID=G4HLZ5_9BACL|nr:oxidoreductase domain protein [Paenibacillus lactis 154]